MMNPDLATEIVAAAGDDTDCCERALAQRTLVELLVFGKALWGNAVISLFPPTPDVRGVAKDSQGPDHPAVTIVRGTTPGEGESKGL